MPKMLVLGDSIQWGQGLRPNEKIWALVAAAWDAGDPMVVTSFAHSGADIWKEDQSGALAALDPDPPAFPPTFSVSDTQIKAPQIPQSPADPAARDAVGEIPSQTPYLLCQILDAAAFDGSDFDLVLVDAGINDTEIYNLVLPGKNQQAVVERCRSLQPRVQFMLEKVRDTFPKAKVIVTGYYPLISDDSDTWQLVQLWRSVARAAAEEAVDEARKLLAAAESAGAPELMDRVMDLRPSHPLAPFVNELSARCEDWTSTMHAVIEDAIEAADSDGTRMRFADPGFAPENALFASASLLWAIEDGKPTDPCAAARAAYCMAHGIRGFYQLIIDYASLGHPTADGAARYAKAVLDCARDLKLLKTPAV